MAPTRAESLAADPLHRGRWQAVLARAVADLTELAELSLPLLQPAACWWPGSRLPLDAELARAERAVGTARAAAWPAASDVAVPGLEDHVLAVVEKVAATPPEFPRDPAARRRRPL